METKTIKKEFEEVYREISFLGGIKYFTNFKFINEKGDYEFCILRIDKKTYSKKINKVKL